MENEVKNYLGIDWGKAKVGLAVADEETKIAFAFDIIKNKGNLVEKIIEIIKENNVKEIVIGIPSYINKEETIYAGEKLGEKIKRKIKLNVSYQNEMFTTKMAQANLIEKGEKNIGKKDDAEAARIILQEWLDKQ
jgi:putative pre-16S rRNA nuclease